jgi:7-cyano-7-deazaguanine synthase in queuosine biosynthesis
MKDKKILLIGGGLDTYCIYKLEDPCLSLYVDIGVDYAEYEIKALERLGIENLIVDRRLDLSDFELDNHIVPLRNLFFVSIALNYGNHVILGATAGDTTPDKDDTFAGISNQLFNHILSDSKKNPKYWKEGMEVKIDLPYRSMTKTEIVRKYLDAGFDKDGLTKTKSCYNAIDGNCGKCRNCFRKWVAFINNDIGGGFLNNPYDMRESYFEYIANKDRGREMGETRKAVKKYENLLCG